MDHRVYQPDIKNDSEARSNNESNSQPRPQPGGDNNQSTHQFNRRRADHGNEPSRGQQSPHSPSSEGSDDRQAEGGANQPRYNGGNNGGGSGGNNKQPQRRERERLRLRESNNHNGHNGYNGHNNHNNRQGNESSQGNGGSGYQQQNHQHERQERHQQQHAQSSMRPAGLELEDTYHSQNLKAMGIDQLHNLAASLGIQSPETLYKQELVFVIMQRLAEYGCNIVGNGVLDVIPDGYGFLRSAATSYAAGPYDVYVSHVMVQKYGLRTGDLIECSLRLPRKGERYFAMNNINTINGGPLSQLRMRPYFDDLTALFPQEQIILENSGLSSNISSRLIDIMAPIGRGQRALVVAPPRTGKTVLMQNIAHAITANYPEIELIVLLIGERPEEVTDMVRSVRGEVISSTFDEPSQRHAQLAEIAIEKAKRLVEMKKDVVILLDSITRLARAYNDIAPSSGKILSGGVDSNALQKPKRFFGAARNIEEGGSLTIIATTLIETGSRMDEVIFEEFKGTGNSELILDRKVSDKRMFPALDITKSGTRREDILIGKANLAKIWILRRIINNMSTSEALEFLVDKLKMSKSNAEFFMMMDTYNPKNERKM